MLYFLKYSFRWGRTGFVIVNGLTIALLMLVEMYPGPWAPLVGVVHFYLVILYPIFSAHFIILGIANNLSIQSGVLYSNFQTSYGYLFSGKYLQALPLSKLQLIVGMIISNIYTLVPAFVTILWIGIRWNDGIRMLYFEEFDVLKHPFISLVGFILIYFIVRTVPILRTSQYKHDLDSFMLATRVSIKFLVIMMVLIAVIACSFVLHNSPWFFILALAFYGIYQFWCCYQSLLKEDLSYWKTKRDLIRIGMYLVVGLTSAYLIYLGMLSKTKDWSRYYAEGPPIFKDISNEKWESVEEYISRKGDLGIVNQNGVGLIHSLSLVDFKKVRGLEQVFVVNADLLDMPLKKKDKPCGGLLYCEGLTPIHLLAANNNSNILEKVLEENGHFLRLKTKPERTPLHYASEYCSYKATKVLLEKGADPNAKNTWGDTPLMTAVENGCIIVSLLLFEKGAELNSKNKKGETASVIAKRKNYRKLHFMLEFLGKKNP